MQACRGPLPCNSMHASSRRAPAVPHDAASEALGPEDVLGQVIRARKLPLRISTSWWKGLGQFRQTAPKGASGGRQSAIWREIWSKSPLFRAQIFDQLVEDPSKVSTISSLRPVNFDPSTSLRALQVIGRCRSYAPSAASELAVHSPILEELLSTSGGGCPVGLSGGEDSQSWQCCIMELLIRRVPQNSHGRVTRQQVSQDDI
jgi:hypothetical protein